MSCAVVIEELGREPSQIARWDDYVSAHPAATVYHLAAWRTVFETSFGYRSTLLMARDGSTGATVGALPAYLVSTPFSRRLVSVPFRDRGGLLWDSATAFQALAHALADVAKAAGAASAQIKTIAPYPAELSQAANLLERSYWVHSHLPLADMSVATFLSRIGPKARNVRRAERAGLRFELVERPSAHLQEWYALHLLTQKRLGIPPFPEVFFGRMFGELETSGRIALARVTRDGHAVAAAIFLLHNGIGIYGYGASDERFQEERPNDLLFCRSIEWLIEKGFRVYDMGSDAPAQENLLRYKRTWLAIQAPHPTYFLASGTATISDSSSGRYRAARRVFSKLPTPVLRMSGAVLTKYFG